MLIIVWHNIKNVILNHFHMMNLLKLNLQFNNNYKKNDSTLLIFKNQFFII